MIVDNLTVSLESLPDLLRGYTQRLQEICQREKSKRRPSTAGGTAFGALLGPIRLIVGGALGTQLSRRIPSQETIQAAETLAQLVAMGSQYGEHASKRLENKAELAALVREADAVLASYHTLFRTGISVEAPQKIAR